MTRLADALQRANHRIDAPPPPPAIVATPIAAAPVAVAHAPVAAPHAAPSPVSPANRTPANRAPGRGPLAAAPKFTARPHAPAALEGDSHPSPAALRRPDAAPARVNGSGLIAAPSNDTLTAWRSDPDLVGKLVGTEGFSGAAQEQYRKLAAILHHAQVERGVKVIMTSSALPGEGKSLTAVNLALTLAESYQRRVLLRGFGTGDQPAPGAGTGADDRAVQAVTADDVARPDVAQDMLGVVRHLTEPRHAQNRHVDRRGIAALVRRMLLAEADRQPVPGIDHGDTNGKGEQLILAELGARLFIDIVRRMGLGDAGQGFRPGQRRAFARGVKLGFMPSIQQQQPVFRLAQFERLMPVHVQAIGAAVDLRHPQVHEIDEPRRQPRLSNMLVHGAEHLHAGRRGRVVVHPL